MVSAANARVGSPLPGDSLKSAQVTPSSFARLKGELPIRALLHVELLECVLDRRVVEDVVRANVLLDYAGITQPFQLGLGQVLLLRCQLEVVIQTTVDYAPLAAREETEVEA